jgi:hypothetical protein
MAWRSEKRPEPDGSGRFRISGTEGTKTGKAISGLPRLLIGFGFPQRFPLLGPMYLPDHTKRLMVKIT